MHPDKSPWLQRWLQTDDDELLYVDQTLLVQGGFTQDELGRLEQAQERLAEAQEAWRVVQELEEEDRYEL